MRWMAALVIYFGLTAAVAADDQLHKISAAIEKIPFESCSSNVYKILDLFRVRRDGSAGPIDVGMKLRRVMLLEGYTIGCLLAMRMDATQSMQDSSRQMMQKLILSFRKKSHAVRTITVPNPYKMDPAMGTFTRRRTTVPNLFELPVAQGHTGHP